MSVVMRLREVNNVRDSSWWKQFLSQGTDKQICIQGFQWSLVRGEKKDGCYYWSEMKMKSRINNYKYISILSELIYLHNYFK